MILPMNSNVILTAKLHYAFPLCVLSSHIEYVDYVMEHYIKIIGVHYEGGLIIKYIDIPSYIDEKMSLNGHLSYIFLTVNEIKSFDNPIEKIRQFIDSGIYIAIMLDGSSIPECPYKVLHSYLIYGY